MAEAQVSGYQSQASAPRERKFSAVELGPNGGIVEMADLASEDQALAQFGYKPVYTHLFITVLQRMASLSTASGLSTISRHQQSIILRPQINQSVLVP